MPTLRSFVAALSLLCPALSSYTASPLPASVHQASAASPLLCPALSSYAQETVGKDSLAVVDISVAHMREAPDYTAEMGTEALMGSVVKVLDRQGYWRKVRCDDDYVAWVNALALKEMDANELQTYQSSDKYICLSEYAIVHCEPTFSSPMVSDLVKGDVLLDGKATRRGFRAVSTASGRTGWVRKEDLAELESWEASRHCTGDAIASEALRHVGIPYLWGGASPKGFDCSGLTSFCFRMNGMILPRNASAQARLGTPVDCSALQVRERSDGDGGKCSEEDGEDFTKGNGGECSERDGRECSARDGRDCSALRRGDLLFFGDSKTGKVSHVGIYIGEGRMVHASQLVRINSVVAGRPDSYENMHKLLMVRRICPEE